MKHRWRGFAWISILTFLFLWTDLVRNLSSFWSANPQYAYGWTVPALSLFLLWECWITRSAPAPAARRGRAFLLAGILAACLLPTRLVLEATPDWRIAQWALAAEVVGLSLCAVYLLGGRPWLLHFAFPIAFIFVSVPWPVNMEQSLIQTLTEWVTTLTVDGLNLCDIPAIRKGQIIEISTGIVGVEEACSGIRSFQATLMAALFLGQLWTFRWRSRLVLIGAGVVFAFFCNVGRALLLSFVAEKNGIAAIDKWHDPAGFTILGICFVGLLGLALLLRPKVGRGLAAAAQSQPSRLSSTFVAALAAWVLLAALGTEWWYRSAPAGSSAWWRVEWPENQPGFAEIPMAPKVREMQFDAGRQAHWREDDGSQWTMFISAGFRASPSPAVSPAGTIPTSAFPPPGSSGSPNTSLQSSGKATSNWPFGPTVSTPGSRSTSCFSASGRIARNPAPRPASPSNGRQRPTGAPCSSASAISASRCSRSPSQA